MQELFEVLAGWAKDGKTNEHGLPDLLRLSVLLRYFHNSIRSSSERANRLAVLLAPVGALLGYRREVERYIRAAAEAGSQKQQGGC